jgi:hypothetical protein
MSRLVFAFIFTILLFSGAAKSQNKTKALAVDSTTYYKQQLIGKWRIYSFAVNQSSSMCDICPRVNFKADGTLEISNTNENIKLVIQKNTVYFKANRTFPTPPYKIHLQQKKGYTELYLSNKDKMRSFILRR